MTPIFLFLCSAKDPATIPGRDYMLSAYEKEVDKYPEEGDEREKYLDIIGDCMVKMKYCTECRIFRPPRTVHCW